MLPLHSGDAFRKGGAREQPLPLCGWAANASIVTCSGFMGHTAAFEGTRPSRWALSLSDWQQLTRPQAETVFHATSCLVLLREELSGNEPVTFCMPGRVSAAEPLPIRPARPSHPEPPSTLVLAKLHDAELNCASLILAENTSRVPRT